MAMATKKLAEEERLKFYDREMKDDLREALKAEAFLRMLVWLQDLYIKVEGMAGQDLRKEVRELIETRIGRCRLELGMEALDA
jgi:hypothetical protein